MPVVLYVFETWSLTLREERKLRVFDIMLLRRIFGLKRDELTREWRKLHNEDLNDLHSSPSIVRVIKSGRMKLTGHVARMGRGETYTRFWLGSLKEREHLGDPGVDESVILRWIFRNWDRAVYKNRDRWRELLNTVMTFRAPQNVVIS